MNDAYFDKLSTNTTDLAKYMKRVVVSKEGGMTWTGLHILHSSPWHKLEEYCKEESGANSFGVYLCTIQTDSLTKVGWLLHSFKDMDMAWRSEYLTNKIGRLVGLS